MSLLKKKRLSSLLGVVAFFLVFGAFQHFVDLKVVYGRFRGEICVVTPSLINLGDRQVGDVVETSALVRNITNRPVTIESASTTCGCVTTEKLPITIQPHESRDFKLLARMKGNGVYDQTVSLVVNGSTSLQCYPIRVTAKTPDVSVSAQTQATQE